MPKSARPLEVRLDSSPCFAICQQYDPGPHRVTPLSLSSLVCKCEFMRLCLAGTEQVLKMGLILMMTMVVVVAL